MTEDEFLVLPPDEAKNVIEQQSPAEQKRLRKLYNSPAGQKRVKKLVSGSRTSAMKTAGMVGTIIGALALLIGFGAALEGHLALLIGASGMLSLFSFMWMLGAIEQRLIEINVSIRKGQNR